MELVIFAWIGSLAYMIVCSLSWVLDTFKEFKEAE